MFQVFTNPNRAGVLSSAGVAGLAMASFLGCGTQSAREFPDLAVLPPDLLLVDMKAPEYPVGSFGGEVNKLIPNLTFQGYWNPTATTGLATETPFGEVTFEMARKSGAKYALVQLGAFW